MPNRIKFDFTTKYGTLGAIFFVLTALSVWAQDTAPKEPASAPAEPAAETPAAVPSEPNTFFPQAQTAQNSEIASLSQREQNLLDQLSTLKPDAPNYNDQMQSIGAQLRDIQSRMQELQTAQPFNPQNLPQGAGAAGAVQPFGFGQGVGSNNNMPNNMNFAAPGANALSGSWPNTPVQGAFDPMTDPMLLKQIKEELTFQLKQIQQTLEILGPQDAALSASLKEQQTDLLTQLKDVTEKLGASPAAAEEAQKLDAAAQAAPAAPPTVPNPQAPNPQPNPQGLDQLNLNDFSNRIQKVNQAAVLLREAGLNDLANHALNQAGELSNPNFVETPFAADAQADWFQPNGAFSQDINELKTSVADLSGRIDQIVSELANIDTQLKLLSRQAVTPSAVPALSAPSAVSPPPAAPTL